MHLEAITVKGVIYARYSSDNQREESIEGQLRECNAYAEKQGITIVDTYIDRALSAKTDNRPSFLKMMISAVLYDSFDISLLVPPELRNPKFAISNEAIGLLNFLGNTIRAEV